MEFDQVIVTGKGIFLSDYERNPGCICRARPNDSSAICQTNSGRLRELGYEKSIIFRCNRERQSGALITIPNYVGLAMDRRLPSVD